MEMLVRTTFPLFFKILLGILPHLIYNSKRDSIEKESMEKEDEIRIWEKACKDHPAV